MINIYILLIQLLYYVVYNAYYILKITIISRWNSTIENKSVVIYGQVTICIIMSLYPTFNGGIKEPKHTSDYGLFIAFGRK